MPAPHPPLQNYYAHAGDRPTWLHGIFDRTASDYDRLEAIIGLGTGPRYRRRALQRAGLAYGMTVIDVGTGTGLLARAAADIVGDPAKVTGVDPSPEMLAHARAPEGMRLLNGSAERLPSADSCADFLCMGFALRHVSDLSTAFAEFHRVLRPGGRVCLLEITIPEGAVPRALLKAWLLGFVPRVAALVARSAETPRLMRYHWDTIAACVPPPAIQGALQEAGFTDVEREVELSVFSAYRARKPG